MAFNHQLNLYNYLQFNESPSTESDLQNNNVEFDSYPDSSTLFRGLTNTEFWNVAPPNTVFGDEDVSNNKEPIVFHIITEEEDVTEKEDITENETETREEVAVDEMKERERYVEDAEENIESDDNVEELKENDAIVEEQVRGHINNEQENILNQSDDNQQDEESQLEGEQRTEENEGEDGEKWKEEDDEIEVQKPAAKRKPKTVLEIVYDDSVPDVPLQTTNPPQVEAAAYVEEDDEEDEKFDLTLTEDLSSFFESPIDPLEFDFSLATNNLKPIREFVTKWGFFKAVPTPDVLQRGQRGVRHFNVPAPRTERGYPLPFPFFLIKPPDMRSFQSIEETLKLKVKLFQITCHLFSLFGSLEGDIKYCQLDKILFQEVCTCNLIFSLWKLFELHLPKKQMYVPFCNQQNAKSFNAFIKFIKHMKDVVDEDELRIRITMKWLSQHSHKIPPFCKNEKTDVAGYAQVHLFYKFCK